MTIQIALIGLDQIGASIGMALASHKNQFYRLGNDRNMEMAKKAKKIDAVDAIEINLPRIVKKSDIVILSVPADELKDIFDAVVQDLKENAVLIDASALKSADTNLIMKKLPKGRFFVSLTPAINSRYLMEPSYGIDTARADLFQNGLMIISCPPHTGDNALELASDLAKRLGAGMLFADQSEVNGLIAASRLLPQLAAASLVKATMHQPGWREAQKLAGSEYAHATAPILAITGERNAAQGTLVNSENALRVLDDLIEALKVVRQYVQSGDEIALHAMLEEAKQARQKWWDQRQQGQWEQQEGVHTSLPTSGDTLSHLFLGGLGKKKTKI